MPQPSQQDLADAAEVIANGLNKGGAQAFKQSTNANETKVTNVVNRGFSSESIVVRRSSFRTRRGVHRRLLWIGRAMIR